VGNTMKSLEQQPLQARFEHLLNLIGSRGFLAKQGLGNEVPFFICPYSLEEAVKFVSMIGNLYKQLQQDGIHVLEINLYDLAIGMLKSRGAWDRILANEPSISKPQLRELLQGILDTEHHLIPAIAAKMGASEFDVLFISGIGEVYPYIRSHNVLNNLQSVAKEKPTITKAGTSLDLFNKLHDDNYYRAFNIFHCGVETRTT
jgi:hypothetical protein